MITSFGNDRNTRLLCMFYIFNYTAIGVSSSGLITDMFLLNTGIDTVRFGTLKSHTFLLPAIFFLLASGVVARLNRDQALCAWCYIIRCAVPALTTLGIILFSPAAEVIYYMVAAMFIVSFTCAAFANNILTRILQQALPQTEFIRGSIYIPAIGGLFCTLVCMGQVWVLEQTAGDRTNFLLMLFSIQFLFTLLEIPAYKSIMALKLNSEKSVPKSIKTVDVNGIKKVFARKELRFILTYMLLRGVYSGMLGAYLAVYLLKFRNWRPFTVVIIEISLAVLIIMTSKVIGKISNKIGIPAFLGISAGVCAAVNFAWGMWVSTALVQWIFLVLIYNGTSGILSSGQVALESGATTLYAPHGRNELSIGFGALARAVGAFSGSCIASWLLGMLPGGEMEKLQNVFMICSFIPLILFFVYLMMFRGPKARNVSHDSRTAGLSEP